MADRTSPDNPNSNIRHRRENRIALPGNMLQAGHSVLSDAERVTWVASLLVFIFALVLYSVTMCRTVFWWDSGEFIANASILGIPHRPGFPLYILLARVFGLAPIGTFFYRVNFLSVLTAAAAAATLTYVMLQLLFRYFGRERAVVYSGLLATVALMATYTFWIQAVRAEVYALNALVVAVIVLLLERADAMPVSHRRSVYRYLYAAAFLFGLGLGGHHATLASTAPALAVLAVVILGRRVVHPGFLLTMMLFLAAGLSIYLYLPIRAAQSPLLNWGWSTGSLSDGARSVMATDAYAYLAQVTPAKVVHKFWQSLSLIITQTGRPLALLSGIGLIYIFFKSRRWGWFLVLLALGNMLVVAIMATEFIEWNADLHGYLLPTMIALTFGMAAGFMLILGYVLQRLERLIRPGHLRLAAKTATVGIVVLLAVSPGALGGVFCNLSNNRLAHDLGCETIGGLPPGAVVVMDGVNWNFVLRGLQFGGGLRPDVALINRSLLPAAWYQDQCRRRYPQLLAELDFPTKFKALEIILWADKIRATGRPVFWEYTERELPYFRRFHPAGHLYRLVDPDSTLAESLIITQEHFELSSMFYGAVDVMQYDIDAQGMYIRNLYRAGLFYERWGLLYRAREMYRRALALKPEESMLTDALYRVENVLVTSIEKNRKQATEIPE